MTVRPSDLNTIPLFHGIPDAHLEELIRVFERVSFTPGEVLFEAGAAPEHLILLVRGEVTLSEPSNRNIAEPRFRLSPIALIGELGAVTGLARNSTAEVTQPSEIFRIGVAELARFFETHSQVAFPIYHNLINIVGDKVRRETRLLDEMRANLIRTQKAMKQLRDRVLESEETALSRDVCETLEDLIEHNRRSHYLVAPARPLPSTVRLDNGTLVPVVELSDGLLRLPVPSPAPASGTPWSSVLVTSSGEIPVSGTVEAIDPRGMLVKLDLLIDTYAAILRDYLTRVQLLDYVV